MRILTVTHFYEGHGGGIERVAGQLCRQFESLGVAATWAASASDDPPDGIEAMPLACINPIEALTGLPMPIPGIKGLQALSKAVRQSDVVVVHDALYMTSILAMLSAKLAGKPVILIQHIAGIPFSSAALRAVMKIANQVVTVPMLRLADRRVFISDTVRQDLLGRSARPGSELLFNGVDGSIFNTGNCTARAASESNARDGNRHILFVGRYVAKKGLTVLRSLAQQRPDLEFILAGSGPIRPADWDLPNVRDLGPQSPAQLADLYRSADLLVLPSVGEGYPLVIQEAMASGLPVLCGSPTDRADPGASEWLHGVEIDLSQPGQSAQRCAAAIDGLNPTAAERLEMARYALKTYDWTIMARRLVRMVEAIA